MQNRLTDMDQQLMWNRFTPWSVFIVLTLNPAPSYPDVATDVQRLFDRFEMSSERAPEVEAIMAEREERWNGVSEQLDHAAAMHDEFGESPAGRRMLMDGDLPYTLEIFKAILRAYQAEDAYYQWELTRLEHYFLRHGAVECLAKLNRVRTHWNEHCKRSLTQLARADVKSREGRIDVMTWHSTYNTDKAQFLTVGGYSALLSNFTSSSLNCRAFNSPSAPQE